MKRHWGVGVIITNPDKELFFLQQKSKTYSFPQYREGYSFFGGEREDGETPEEAMQRELQEEFSKRGARTVRRSIIRLCDLVVDGPQGEFDFSLFESVLETRKLVRLSGRRIYEGKGVLVERDKLEGLSFVWGLEQVAKQYLTGHGYRWP